jgi:tRNA/rRNA methyltransferase
VVLVATRNPLNIGASARAAANFGVSHLRLVQPYDRAFREAKSAVGAEDLLAGAQTYDTVADAVADCSLVIGTSAARRRQIETEVVSLKDVRARIRLRARSRVALIFGSEKRGLSNHDLSYCHWTIRIPTVPAAPSMNLAQAVAVCLYEIAHSVKPAVKAAGATRELANSSEVERLAGLLMDCLKESEYLKLSSPSSLLRIRRLVRSLELSPQESQTLTGMLRQMLWKMRQP